MNTAHSFTTTAQSKGGAYATGELIAERRSAALPRAIALPASLAVVQIILAYEWLISGINKLANPNFTVQLAGQLKQSIDGNPYTWYTGFLRQVVLPHATAFGVLTELGETAIGISLIAGAVLWLRRRQTRATIYAGMASCLALASAAFLSLNYFFQGGSSMPWINSANAFNEGVDIDILIPLICVALLVANIRAVRRCAEALRRPSWDRSQTL